MQNESQLNQSIKQLSISEYRERFDSQNIALSKFDEIRRAKRYAMTELNSTVNTNQTGLN